MKYLVFLYNITTLYNCLTIESLYADIIRDFGRNFKLPNKKYKYCVTLECNYVIPYTNKKEAFQYYFSVVKFYHNSDITVNLYILESTGHKSIFEMIPIMSSKI